MSSNSTLNFLQCTACLNKNKKRISDRLAKKDDQSLAKEFDGYLQTVMESLANQLGKNLSQTEKNIEVLKSKFFLIDVCFEKAVDILSITFESAAQNKLVELFTNLRNLVCTSYVTMSQIQGSVSSTISQEKREFEKLIFEKETELKRVRRHADLLQSEKDHDLKKLESQVVEMQTLVA